LKFLFNLQNSIDNLQKYKWPTFIWHTTVEELSKSGEQFIYYAHNLPVEAAPNNEHSAFVPKILEELYEKQDTSNNTSAVV